MEAYYKLKVACDKCSEAFRSVTEVFNKLSKNSKYTRTGSIYHK